MYRPQYRRFGETVVYFAFGQTGHNAFMPILTSGPTGSHITHGAPWGVPCAISDLRVRRAGRRIPQTKPAALPKWPHDITAVAIYVVYVPYVPRVGAFRGFIQEPSLIFKPRPLTAPQRLESIATGWVTQSGLLHGLHATAYNGHVYAGTWRAVALYRSVFVRCPFLPVGLSKVVGRAVCVSGWELHVVGWGGSCNISIYSPGHRDAQHKLKISFQWLRVYS